MNEESIKQPESSSEMAIVTSVLNVKRLNFSQRTEKS